MVMRWLSREWASGGLSEDEWERRNEDWAAHVARMAGLLGDGAELLIEEINLHDARFLSLREATDRVSLRVVMGDLQRGYEFAELTYHDAVVFGSDLPTEQLSEDDLLVGYDEVDSVDGRYEHRMFFWPSGELGIRFGRLEVSRSPAKPSDWAGREHPR